jgi:hypothetical protein
LGAAATFWDVIFGTGSYFLIGRFFWESVFVDERRGSDCAEKQRA